MSDAAVASAQSAPAQAGSPKKPSKAASKKPRVKPAHPPTSEMVIAAIKNLKERGGSSLQAIKKYITANYKIDAEKLAPFIKKYLKSAVTSGSLVQTKGKGASGSFKLKVQEKGEPKKTKARAAVGKKPAAKKLTKKPATGKVAAKPKKVAVTKAVTPKAKNPKSPSKAKKATKGSPTKKPKAPEPKKTTKPKTAAAKKAAPKKK